jgi:tripartite-type tricarboxylate transporter receptor subunit TctC
MTLIRTAIGMLALTLASTLTIPSAAADSYPERPVRIIVPTSAGGSIDALARTIAAQLSAKWNKPVVVENRSGAAMILGVDSVAKTPPDGYTLLVAHDGAMAMNPALYPTLPYQPQRDFEPLSMLVSIPEVILASASMGAKSLGAFIDLAKQRPGKLNHATGGPASLLAFELFKEMAGVDIVGVQYRGAAPSVTAVIAGEAQLCITDIASANPALQSDRVHPLAVTTSTRAKRFPSLSPANEAGVPGYDVRVWIGLFAPAGTPKEIQNAIELAVKEAIARPDVKEKLEATGMEMRSGSANELRDALAADTAKWAKLVKEKRLLISQ